MGNAVMDLVFRQSCGQRFSMTFVSRMASGRMLCRSEAIVIVSTLLRRYRHDSGSSFQHSPDRTICAANSRMPWLAARHRSD
jgi:hypothetical protein